MKEAQEKKTCTDKLAIFLMKIHDIVLRTQSFFVQSTIEEREEAKSYSIARWIERGIQRIDLESHHNPFSYIYAGCYLNMMNRILRMRKKEAEKTLYIKKMVKQARAEFPMMDEVEMTTMLF